jgi:hypothetical protein
MEIMYLVFLIFFLLYLYIWFLLEKDIKGVLIDKSLYTSIIPPDNGKC